MAITAAQGLNRIIAWIKANPTQVREVRIRRHNYKSQWKVTFWIDNQPVSFTCGTTADLVALEQALIDAGA